jgi:hypothetical protein
VENAKIKNYTTSVPVSRTMAAIEQELLKIGVTHIERSYEAGKPVGMVFSVQLPGMEKLSFRVPAKTPQVFELIKSVPGYKTKSRKEQLAQAERVAWRQMLNWIEIQVVMIQLKQADPIELFMAFVYLPKQGKTFYEKVASDGLKLLTE